MTISFEFFPPKSAETQAQLGLDSQKLAGLKPSYVSVTYGAGGSTRDGTRLTVEQMRAQFGDVAPHVSCIGASRADIQGLLEDYKAMGIRRIVALRGDLPSGYGHGGEFMHAIDLVRFTREKFGDQFFIEVAAYPEFHPQARSADLDLHHFVEKMKAGANGAITQYFFNSDAYFRLVDEAYAKGVDQPIVPGIMPITNFNQLARFSDACGTEIPRWIRQRLQSYGDDAASIRAFGHEVVTDLVDQLLTAGVPGIHFYTMNKADPILKIAAALKLDGRDGLGRAG
ncbi:MAG: methylenetetrahydrofolate reductase [NAD(P)H] [Proteobacteria bacterium]|jgi:methylenetetrahydrofolate reductase (NADPH)|nr:methylenetetrahydrofolate reductase [NAD(P)H] [Pseudomonadota bacterium]